MKLIMFLIVVLLLNADKSLAQYARFKNNNFTNQKGDTLRYRLLTPDYDTSRLYPLVVFLHGSGERGNDNEAQLKWGVTNFATDQMMMAHPAYVLAPQCPENQEWSAFMDQSDHFHQRLKPTPSKPMDLLVNLIKQLCKTNRIDTSRIYITGVSMGGYGTYDAIERYPHLFAAAVPVCGAGDETKAADIAAIPIWIYHGAEDPAVNVSHAYEMNTALVKAGAHPGLTIYPATGHFSWLGAYTDALMLEWLFQQHK